MSRCWIGVAAAAQVRRGAEGGFVMFAHGRHEAAKRLSPGDFFVYYAPREWLDEGAQVRAFIEIGQIAPGDPAERQMSEGASGWSRPAEFWDARIADVYPLLPQLSFVRDPRHWGMAFRRSLFEVPAVDFRLIAAAMGVVDRIKE